MMNRKQRQTLSATTLAVYLSLNVEIIDDRRGVDFLALPLLSLTWLLVAGWWAQARVANMRSAWRAAQVQCSVQRGLNRWLARLELAQTVAGIGWRSVAWGIGI